MWENVKAFAKWVWDWITVVVATVLGALSEMVQYIDQLTGLDWSQVMTRERAAMVTFWTAVLKIIVSVYVSRKSADK